MTIQGAIYELNNMLFGKDIPCYWKPVIKKIIETVEQTEQNVGEMSEKQTDGDLISRQAVLNAIDVKAWEFCDYLIRKNRNYEQEPVSHFADNLRECVREELPSAEKTTLRTEKTTITDGDLISKTEFIEYINNWFEKVKYYHPYSKCKTIPMDELMDLIKQIPNAEQTGLEKSAEGQTQVEKQVKDLEEAGKWFLEGVIEGFNEQTKGEEQK